MAGAGCAWQGACVVGGQEHAWGACMAGGVHARGSAWWGHTWWEAAVCVWGGGHAWQEGVCGRRNGNCSRQYACYWNAFLSLIDGIIFESKEFTLLEKRLLCPLERV